MAFDQAADAFGGLVEARPALQDRAARAAAEVEQDLVAERAADECDRDDGREEEVAAVRRDACKDEEGFTLEQAADEEREVSVLREQIRRRQAGSLREASRTSACRPDR